MNPWAKWRRAWFVSSIKSVETALTEVEDGNEETLWAVLVEADSNLARMDGWTNQGVDLAKMAHHEAWAAVRAYVTVHMGRGADPVAVRAAFVRAAAAEAVAIHGVVTREHWNSTVEPLHASALVKCSVLERAARGGES